MMLFWQGVTVDVQKEGIIWVTRQLFFPYMLLTFELHFHPLRITELIIAPVHQHQILCLAKIQFLFTKGFVMGVLLLLI